MIAREPGEAAARVAEGRRVFLSADWRNLVMVSYEVDPSVLVPWLPSGVELDAWNGRTLVSLVGFEFRKTRVLGMSIPGYRQFPEVNLRFYVRRKVGKGWRRGVVFVKELVPRRAIAWTARRLYGERYEATRMNGVAWRVSGPGEGADWTTHVRYWWRGGGRWEGLFAEAKGEWQFVSDDSMAAFIADHAFGYSSCRGRSLEYDVEHPPWRVLESCQVRVDCDLGRLYGEHFGEALQDPCSAFIVEGSAVVVRWGRRIG